MARLPIEQALAYLDALEADRKAALARKSLKAIASLATTSRCYRRRLC